VGDGGEGFGVRHLLAFIRTPAFFHRIIFMLCAVSVSVPVVCKSRPDRVKSASAAFSVSTSAYGYVRISGAVRHPGMYPLTVKTMTKSAIKMADPLCSSLAGISEADAAAYLENGMALHLLADQKENVTLKRGQMPANERITMGVPLDINALSEADFDKLPGIGPVMARRIVEYRHKNGGTMKLSDLLLIEGIGEKKYNYLLKYF
jgi:competence protein ComEA